MYRQVKHVVGDLFQAFGKNTGVLTLSELRRLIAGDVLAVSEDEIVLLGQGIQHEVRVAMTDYLRSQAVPVATLPVPAQAQLVGKTQPHNVLIAAPKRISTDAFKTALVIDPRCTPVSDHVTGLHVSAAVLKEAGTQFITAVVPQMASEHSSEEDWSLAPSTETEAYREFVFPLPCQLNLRVKEARDSVLFEISFHQGAAQPACSMTVEMRQVQPITRSLRPTIRAI